MKTNIIGIDPGSDGAAAVINYNHELIDIFRFEKATEQAIIRFIRDQFLENSCIAFLEQVHSAPGQGVKSMFTFGKNYGFVRGVIGATPIPMRDVTPQVWQKTLGLAKSYASKPIRKRAHQQVAEQWFPKRGKITLSECDAVLIAEYGYVMTYGKGSR